MLQNSAGVARSGILFAPMADTAVLAEGGKQLYWQNCTVTRISCFAHGEWFHCASGKHSFAGIAVSTLGALLVYQYSYMVKHS